MATNNELMDLLEKSAKRSEDTSDAYYEVLTSEGEKDIQLSDGTTTPNLNKRIKELGGQVTSVAGKIGDVTIDDISESLELGSASKYNVSDLQQDKLLNTWSNIKQDQHNKSFATFQDFGLVGDSNTDNTAALTSAVNHYLTTKTKVYLPDTGKYYKATTSYADELIRSAFYGGGLVRQAGVSKIDKNRTTVRTTKAEGYSANSSAINPQIDFKVESSRVVNEFKRIGQSPNNAMQGFCYDLKTGEFFTYHVSTTVASDRGVEYGVLNRYDGSHTTGGVFQSVQSSTPQKSTGHQGLGVSYDDNGERWFFASAHADDAKAGAYIVSFQWSNTNNDLQNMRKIKVFDDSKTTSATTTPNVSPDGRYLAVKRNESPVSSETGQGAYRIRVFDLPKMLRSGLSDWSNDFLHEFTVESYDLNGVVYSFQNLAIGFDLITCLFGNSDRNTPVNLLTYTLDGRLVSADKNVRVGMSESQDDDPASPYEPEAITYSYYLGVPVLYTMVTSGLSGARIARLYASSANIAKKFDSQISIPVGGSIKTVDITNNGDYLTGYRRGEKKIQVYASASQTRITAHSGNLLALVVQNDSDTTGSSNWEWRFNNTGTLYPSSNGEQSLGGSTTFLKDVKTKSVYYSATVFDSAGSGSPEGVLSAGIGSTYRDTKNGDFYIKKSGTGNTGWVAK